MRMIDRYLILWYICDLILLTCKLLSFTPKTSLTYCKAPSYNVFLTFPSPAGCVKLFHPSFHDFQYKLWICFSFHFIFHDGFRMTFLTFQRRCGSASVPVYSLSVYFLWSGWTQTHTAYRHVYTPACLHLRVSHCVGLDIPRVHRHVSVPARM